MLFTASDMAKLTDNDKKLHAGHRQRMKEKLFKNGIEGLDDYEVLEYFLYYSLPYVNTNEIAHKLINEFGSLNNVINAEYDRLVQVDGMGPHTASMFYFFRSLAKLYLANEYKVNTSVHEKDKLCDYCKALYIAAENEEIRLIFLTDDLFVIHDKLICVGTPGKVELPFRVIARELLETRSSRVVITHNHPQGSSMPSRADIDETYKLWQTLRNMQVELVDHVIVGRDGVWSMRFNHTIPDIWGM